MDQSWLGVVWPALQLIALLVVPGGIVCVVFRPPPVVFAAAAVPVSVSTVALSALVAGMLGPWWGIGAVAAGTAVMALVAWALKRTQVSDPAESWTGPWWLVPVGTILTASVAVFRTSRAIGSGDTVSQSYDALFHLNLLWSIDQRADASPLHVNLDMPQDPVGFYPTGWHSLVSLVDGTGIPQAANASSLVLGWIVAPVGVALLVGAISKSWTAAGIGALFTGILGQFPLLLTWFGLVYPTLLAYVLIPYVLALLVMGLLGKQISWGPLILATLSLPGVALAQPNAAFGLLYLSIPLLFLAAWRRFRWWALLVPPALLLLDAATNLSASIRGMRFGNPEWGTGTLSDSLGRIFLFTAAGPGPGVGWGGIARLLLLVIGIYAAFRIPRGRWLPFTLLVAQMLHFAAFTDVGILRPYFTGVWYGDSMRLASLMGLVGTAIVGLAGWQIALWLMSLAKWFLGLPWLAGIPQRVSRGIGVIASTGCIVVIFAGAQLGDPLAYGYANLAGGFNQRSSEDGSGGGLTTEDGVALMERVDEHVPEDAVIANNPWDGSGLAQVYGDRQVLFPQLGVGASAEARFLAENLRNAVTDPEVCEIADQLNVQYVLDMGPGTLWGGTDNQKRYLKYPGLKALDRIGVAEVIDQEGNAKLMKITACD